MQTNSNHCAMSPQAKLIMLETPRYWQTVRNISTITLHSYTAQAPLSKALKPKPLCNDINLK